MRKTLFLSLLFALLAGSAEAQESPFYYYPDIDEMTGRPGYGERVLSQVQIKGTSLLAQLSVHCGLDFYKGLGGITLQVYDSKKKDDREQRVYFSCTPSSDISEDIKKCRIKFDNKEPFYAHFRFVTYGGITLLAEIHSPNSHAPGRTPAPNQEQIYRDWEKLINGMKKYNRIWIEFLGPKLWPYRIAKFNLTGFSRELAKCSRIPDTN